jgi:hypothetical protein
MVETWNQAVRWQWGGIDLGYVLMKSSACCNGVSVRTVSQTGVGRGMAGWADR